MYEDWNTKGALSEIFPLPALYRSIFTRHHGASSLRRDLVLYKTFKSPCRVSCQKFVSCTAFRQTEAELLLVDKLSCSLE